MLCEKLAFRCMILLGAMILLLSVLAQAQEALSPREQVQQYVAELQKNPSDDALREKILKLAEAVDPKPKVPPRVDELAGKGQYILEHAASDAELPAAADAFAQASLLAPWVPDYYYDQGLVWERAKDYQKAVKNYELYLIGVPADSDDARKARQHLGGVKYALDQQQSADAARRQQEDLARRQEEQRQREQEQLQNQWSGVWRITGGARRVQQFRGVSGRWDNYYLSHVMFQISGDQITETWCQDRPDSYGNRPGRISSRKGHVSGGVATFTAFGETDRLQVNSNGEIEDNDARFPGEIPFIYSRVNDPSSTSSACPW